MASPIAFAIEGIILTISVKALANTTPNEVTNVPIIAPPEAKAAANAVIPADIPVSPTPSNTKLPENNATAPVIVNNIGANGANAYIAAVSTPNEPANITIDLIISPHVISPNFFIALPNTTNALDATNKAAEPEIVPVIALKAKDNAVKDPPSVINDLHISPKVMVAISLRAPAITIKELATINNPVLVLSKFLGISFIDKPKVTNEAAVLANPSRKVDHFITENILIGAVNASRAPANIIIPVDVDIILLSSTNLVKPANPPKRAPTPTKPFNNSLHDKSANIFTTLASVLIDEANANSFTAPPAAFSPLPRTLLDIATVVDNAITPANPTANCLPGISTNFCIADVNTNTAPAKAINPNELVVRPPPILFIATLYAPIVVINVATAPIAMNISLVSKPDNFSTATDSINKLVAMLTKPFILVPPANLDIIDILAVKAANIEPIAAKAGIKSSISIVDIRYTEPAIAAIAKPILNSMSAFKFFWYDSKDVRIPSIVLHTLSFISDKTVKLPLRLSKALPAFFKKLPKSKKNLLAMKPVTI